MATVEEFCNNPPIGAPATEDEVCLNWGVIAEMHTQVCAFLQAGGASKTWLNERLVLGAEITVDVTFQGTIPVLTRVDDGEFLITNQAASIIKGFTVKSATSPSFRTGGAFRISVADTDNNYLYGVYSVHQGSDGRKVDDFAGVVEKQIEIPDNTVQVDFSNVENITGGFIINCAITQ